MPETHHTTSQTPDGSWVYTLYLNGSEVLTSGPFFLKSDADTVGAHFASDPAMLQDFLKR